MGRSALHFTAQPQSQKGGEMKDELISFDAIALGELVRKKEVKPAELLEITIQRIEKIIPS